MCADDEYTKTLQEIDPHSIEFVKHLKNEVVIYNLICMCEQYAESIRNKEQVCSWFLCDRFGCRVGTCG